MFSEELGEFRDGDVTFVRTVRGLEDIESGQCRDDVFLGDDRGVGEDAAGRLERGEGW